MKVTLLTENLQKKLSFSNKAISSRNQLPILSHVLLEAKENEIILSSTDLEIGIEIHIPCEVEEKGGIAVPARAFLEIANALPQEKITLTTQDEKLEIKSSKTKTVLQIAPKDEFPLLYEEKGDKVAVFQEGDLKKTFSRILFAASVESTRPALSGVLLKKQDDHFVVVATDGYRLSLDTILSTGEGSALDSLLIPARLLREAMLVFDSGETSIYLSSKNNQIIFEQKETLLVGRTIEADFPAYEKVIPTDTASEVQLDREELLRAVKSCAIFAREAANVITFALQQDKVVVSSKSSSLGENVVEVEGKLTGEENGIAFNAKYLLEALSVLSDNDITFSMTGPLNPGVFRVTGDKEYLHLIMPIRT